MGSVVTLFLNGVGFSVLEQGQTLKPRTLRVQSCAHHVPAQSPRSQLRTTGEDSRQIGRETLYI